MVTTFPATLRFLGTSELSSNSEIEGSKADTAVRHPACRGDNPKTSSAVRVPRPAPTQTQFAPPAWFDADMSIEAPASRS